jgi:hypothetical protein
VSQDGVPIPDPFSLFTRATSTSVTAEATMNTDSADARELASDVAAARSIRGRVI